MNKFAMSLVTLIMSVLPHHLLSRFARRLAYSKQAWLKHWMIHAVIIRFKVDLSDAAEPNPDAYRCFNDFFTRPLRPDARRADPDPRTILMPADGFISQLGPIDRGQIFQAKGRMFTCQALLGSREDALAFHSGCFATIYLSPRDYHRVHMPWAGRLVKTVHVPGRLWSVGPATVKTVTGVFARNERLICHFETDFGPMAIIMVGALLVSGIETVWNGVEIPSYTKQTVERDWRSLALNLPRFAQMAHFNYGSTVIVLLPERRASLIPHLTAGQAVRVGQGLAQQTDAKTTPSPEP